MIPYLLHSTILLSVLYLFFWLMLRNETFYKLNRFVLLSIVVISVTLPLIKVPPQLSFHSNANSESILYSWNDNPQASAVEPQKQGRAEPDVVNTNTDTASNSLSTLNIVWYIYIGGVILFSIAFLFQFVLLLYKKSTLEFIKDGRIKIYELTDDSPPFSFYKWIFINPVSYNSETYHQIIAHEKVHTQQYHSLDMLIGELGIIIFWFNPLVWFLKKSISNNLEFLTDNELLSEGVEPESYQLSLLEVSVPQHPLNFTTNYNQSILQKRINMMNTKKSSAKSSWKYFVLVPIVAFSVSILNATYLPNNTMVDTDTISNVTNIKTHRAMITKELKFTNKSSQNLLSVSNITGAIDVQAYEGDVILMEIEKIITAPTDAELQRGLDEINIKTTEEKNTHYVYLDSPNATYNVQDNQLSFQNDCYGKPCFDYQFQLRYTIKIPQGTNLYLSTINGGDISVKNVSSKNITARHISGSIKMKNISGATDAFTISGGITASYLNNPTETSSFTTTSGNIELELQNNLNANISYEIQDGKVISEFDSKKTNKFGLKIGKANVDYNFKILSGNVYLNKN